LFPGAFSATNEKPNKNTASAKNKKAETIKIVIFGTKNKIVSDIAIFVLKRDVKLQLTNQKPNYILAALYPNNQHQNTE